MKNDLFNQTLMKKYSKNFKLTPSKHDLILKHIQKLEEGQFEAETKNYIYFYETWLKHILGYDLDKNILIDEKEEHGQGKSEFILKSGDKKFMVVELKDQNTNLDKPQNRVNDKRTPIDQAFDYAQHTGDIDWILISNYNEFRLYNWHQKEKYISFKSHELLDKTQFSHFMLSFSKKSHIDTDYINKLIDKTVIIEQELEKEFYKLYHETRLMLITELEHQHPQMSRDESVHYTQLILNRYIFICFAEDLNLLPEQTSFQTITSPITNHDLGRSEIWHKLNHLFIDINEGNEFKKIYGYNGGLFQENLEHLKIRDIIDDHTLFKDTYTKWKFKEHSSIVEEKLDLYKTKINPIYHNLLTISTFDFASDLDVNILGHIFENSIGDIEELKKETQGRRKKEGIYYTPEYITDYICRNTILPYLSKTGKANTVKVLMDEYYGSEIEELDQKVKEIKIVDPACGSGAFLNKAADVLLEIHQAIHKKKYKDKQDLSPFFDNINQRREILLKNIYGVDLNLESVEITKLSLFLKVCRKDLKLPNLNNNIKCGNSLTDDPEYTDKPFHWKKEFPRIFDKGGFDIIIGNPPYVRQEKIKEIKPYLKENYKSYTGMADLYVYFFEKGLNLLKTGGILSFISSNKFTRAKYGKPLRKHLLKYHLMEYNDYTGKDVFTDATVDPCVIIIKKEPHTPSSCVKINNDFNLELYRLENDSWSLEPPEILDLKDKINTQGVKIKNIDGINIYYGIKTGFNEAFIINKEIKDKLIQEDPKNKEIIKPILRGRDIKKWTINYQNLYLLYIPWTFPIDDYPIIKDYLLRFKLSLEKRPEVKSGRVNWYALSRYASDYYGEFEKEKILWLAITDKPKFTLNKSCFVLAPAYIMTINHDNHYHDKYILSILNSQMSEWYLDKITSSTGQGTNQWSKIFVEQLPIYPATPEQQKPFIELADQMLQFNKDLMDEINGFKDWLQRTYKIEKRSQKLDKYYELSFDEFLVELKKKKVNVNSRKTQELLKTEFEESVEKIKPLQEEIAITDKKIDNMVYQLYELTNEEIQIIENYLK